MGTTSGSDLTRARLICAAAYAVALVGAAAAFAYGPTIDERLVDPFWRVVFADVVGTVAIFAFSAATNNSSMYDAYWSVAPIAMALCWTVLPLTATAPQAIPLRAWLVTALIAVWGVRLTYNWARHWRGLKHEDWRYVDLRKQTGPFYWVVSFFGLHMFPTVMVLLCSFSVWLAISTNTPLGWLDAVAVVVTVGAIAIETIADRQLHNFVSSNTDSTRIMGDGLWGWSRHPNYFGEMTFWWGMFLFAAAASSDHLWAVFGPACLTGMFVFISIPMIEKRMLRKRPHFAEHKKRVSCLIPLPPARSS